jgi:cytochrome c
MKIVWALMSAVSLLWLGAGAAIAADTEAGEKVFSKCMQCHRIGLGATNFYGPVLNGLIGRKAGTVPGYKYSAATESSGIVWKQETLSSYLKQPKHDVPGTNMTFPGLQSQMDIDNVIAYISQFGRDGGKN